MPFPNLRHLPILLLSLITSFPQPTASHTPIPSIKINQSFLKPDTKVPSHPVQHVLEHEPKSPEVSCDCQLSGPIEATQCDYETIETVTEDLFGRLDNLVKTPFFKYYKVDLLRDCPFWQENSFCMNRRCGVETLDESEIPEHWRAEALSKLHIPTDDEGTRVFPGCYYRDSDYCFLDDESSGDVQYIDLTLNPEAFTGYAGASAHRVWSSIYDENCFGQREEKLADGSRAPALGATLVEASAGLGLGPVAVGGAVGEEDDGKCLEKRVYYKIISGLHASISTHLCYEYLDQGTGEWSPNLSCFIRRVASHPERLQHIYFNTVLLLRALTRVGPYLSTYDIRTGDVDQDALSKAGLAGVVDVARKVGRFDERGLFQGENADVLKEEFKAHFRNVSRIMDCVGCDKCRLWGKVQTSGIGTALKILFELDEKTLDPFVNPTLLQRSEVVVLLNTLHRSVESLHMTTNFRRMWAQTGRKGEMLSEVGDGDEIVPMRAEQKQELRFPAPTEEPVTVARTAKPSKPSPRLPRPDDPAPDNGIYTRLLELVQACSTRSASACADLVKLVLGLADKVASVFSTSGKEHGPSAGGEL